MNRENFTKKLKLIEIDARNCSQISMKSPIMSNRYESLNVWTLRHHFTANPDSKEDKNIIRRPFYIYIYLSSIESLITSNEHTLQSTSNWSIQIAGLFTDDFR